MKSANNIPLLINVMIDRNDTTAPFESMSRNRTFPANMQSLAFAHVFLSCKID